jgi:hypothetical protein
MNGSSDRSGFKLLARGRSALAFMPAMIPQKFLPLRDDNGRIAFPVGGRYGDVRGIWRVERA